MKISLVVPVRDEEKSVARLLESISRQTRLPDESVFVDAGSRDRTKEILEGYGDKRLIVRAYSIGPAYPGTARNAGVRQAQYEIIAFTDGGIELDKNWLDALSLIMEEDGSCDIVYGSYVPRADSIFKQCLSIAVVPPSIFKEGFRMRPFFIASSLLKKSAWEAVGGFPDFRAAEDRIFMEKIKEKGFRIRFSPRATVIWDIPGSLKEVFNRYYIYSCHDLVAGRSRDWHLPVLKMYLAAFFLVCLGIFISPIFIFLAIGSFLLRVIRKIYKNREEPYFKLRNIPVYLPVACFLIFFIDMACFGGWVRYILMGHRYEK